MVKRKVENVADKLTGGKLREQVIEDVVEGHVQDIGEWFLRDVDSLRLWIRDVIAIDKMPLSEIRDRYGVYLNEDDDEDW